jgi:hypothetical protein
MRYLPFGAACASRVLTSWQAQIWLICSSVGLARSLDHGFPLC